MECKDFRHFLAPDQFVFLAPFSAPALELELEFPLPALKTLTSPVLPDSYLAAAHSASTSKTVGLQPKLSAAPCTLVQGVPTSNSYRCWHKYDDFLTIHFDEPMEGK
jgi:hypothetical protein